MNKITEYVPFFKGIVKRTQYIGFLNFIKEYWKYYYRYSKLPLKMGFKPDLQYKLYVLYNYIKICYFLFDEKTEFILKNVPRRIQKYLLPKINPLEMKYIAVNKVEFYRLVSD